jgi:MFS family permease
MSKPLGIGYWKLWSASVISNLGDGVSIIAYPWLASALTRNPIHIAAVAVVTRLPWLLFALPAGVITDRVDRRKLVAWMDVFRFLFTIGIAVAVFLTQSELSSPEAVESGLATPPGSAGLLLALVYLAAFLLGTAEVLRDNSAQTLLPSIVTKDNLEKANGRMWGAEMVMNAFVGPPLAGILLAVSFSLPFFFDAGTFAVAAALVFLIAGDFRPKQTTDPSVVPATFWTDLKEGVKWLWSHPLFRPMGLALAVLNATAMMAQATFVLFAQELLELDATRFGLLFTGFALGGVIGSFVADRISKAIGQGRSLFTTIIVSALTLLVSGMTSSFWVFWAMGLVMSTSSVLWNVITVSLRQSLIPDRILGRVNSVYRFLGWGMMPVGAAIGGAVVAIVDPALGRELALRMPFLVAALITLGLFIYALPRLNSARIDEAKRHAEDAGLLQ